MKTYLSAISAIPAIFIAAIFARIFTFASPFAKWLPDRIEVTTALTSWPKLQECISLKKHGISPYEGDICHQPPLMILFFNLFKMANDWFAACFFVVCDLVSAWLLLKAAGIYTRQQLGKQKDNCFAKGTEQLLLKEEDLNIIPLLVALLYLFNPYTIFSCVALSTVVVNNVIMSLSLYLLIRGNQYFASMCLSAAAYLSFYPLMLIVPFCIDKECKVSEDKSSKFTLKSIKTFFIFLLSSAGLLALSYGMFTSWNFLDATYLFILRVSDLTPNMGLFWYFFQEMFDHFRLFFLCVLQIHAFIYLLPFTIVFRNRPIFFCYILLSSISWCKTYPTFGDLSIPLALLPLWKTSFCYLRTQFIVAIAFVFSTVMAPVLHYLWIYCGSGNANFFYAVTLAFNLSQIMLLSDVVYAYLRRDFHLKGGLQPLTEDVKQVNTKDTATSCNEYAKNIADYSTADSITLNNREVDGVWTSLSSEIYVSYPEDLGSTMAGEFVNLFGAGCETYNGPQFVLRKYIIGQDGRWYAAHRHFKDGWCSQPSFTMIIKGVYKIGARNNLGGHNGEFSARSFLLVPHDNQELVELYKVVEKHCPKAGLSDIRKDSQGRIVLPLKTNYTLSRDLYRHATCRNRFGVHMYTLKRLRIFRDRKTSNINDELYFGESPTHRSRRRSYVPAAYHYPLKRASSKCQVCKKLGSAKEGETVRLSTKSWTRGIADEWTSTSCQATSNTFMSRYLKLSGPDSQGQRTWRLVYYSFLDSLCKVLSYKIAAEGTYSKPVRSEKIPGAIKVSFNLTNTEITPYEMLFVGSLQAEPEGTCGVSAKWKAGVTQSVKSTNGCRLFKIKIPSIEYDILKTIRNDNGELVLYTGQSSTAPQHILHNTPEKRPTSFQLPLRRCRDVTKGIKALPSTQSARTRKIKIHKPVFTLPKRDVETEPIKKEPTKRNTDPNVAESRDKVPSSAMRSDKTKESRKHAKKGNMCLQITVEFTSGFGLEQDSMIQYFW
eukprot:gene18916-20820_t